MFMLDQLKVKLEKEKRASIVYLGGSITEGAGATAKENCWQAKLHNWFRQTYSDCEVNGYNVGIGGTSSELGVFRTEKDVLAYNPDLVLVEFAVNDYGREPQEIKESMEGIVRKIKDNNKNTDILFVYTATVKMEEECYSHGTLPPSLIAHEEVAKYYNIPTINMGIHLLETLKTKGYKPEELLPDLVHPNDKGYDVYFSYLKEEINKLLTSQESTTYEYPKAMNKQYYRKSTMISAHMVTMTDFRKEHLSLCDRYPEYISSNQPGDSITYEFEGTGIGLFLMISKDSGFLEWNVDEGEWQELNTWDTYALRFNRANHKMLTKQLDYGKHVLRMRVSRKREERSLGQFIRIVALLVL